MKKLQILLIAILLSATTIYGQKEEKKKMTLKEKIQAKLDAANEKFAENQKTKSGFPSPRRKPRHYGCFIREWHVQILGLQRK